MIFTQNISPEIFSIGPGEIRWYGLLFVTGIVLNFLITRWIFKREKFNVSDLESLAIYLFLGLLIGARLGEVFFYQFDYFWQHPLEIFQVWKGGLSSHGATVGLFVSYLIWIFVHKVKFVKYADVLAIGMPLTAAFVRIGNFFNSEIVGIKTGGDYGVIFKRLGENFPRHPAQLYEAILCLAVFGVLIFVYKKYFGKVKPLTILFLFVGLYFAGRFFVEFYKDLHVLPESFPLSIGQVLSIVPVILAIGFFVYTSVKRRD